MWIFKWNERDSKRKRERKKEREYLFFLHHGYIQPVTQVLIAQRHKQEDTEPQEFGPVRVPTLVGLVSKPQQQQHYDSEIEFTHTYTVRIKTSASASTRLVI